MRTFSNIQKNKMLKSCKLLSCKFFITFLLISDVLYLSGQNLFISDIVGVTKPVVWLRADSLSLDTDILRDVSGNSNHGNFISEKGGLYFDTINYNKAVKIDGGIKIQIPSISKDESRFRIFTVYQSIDSTNEQNLWQVIDTTKTQISQTTNNTYDGISPSEYTKSHFTIPVVTSHSQPFPRNQDELGEINLGSSDSLPFMGKIAEFLIFNKNLTNKTRDQWESYLAIKYGATLKERSYYSSTGDSVWSYYSSKNYSGTIIGIGRDDFFGLNQKQSHSYNNEIIFGIGGELFPTNEDNTEQIENQSYVMLGTEIEKINESSQQMLENGFLLTKYGDYKIQTSNNANDISTFLIIKTNGWEGDLERYNLFIDRSGEGEYQNSAISFFIADKLDDTTLIFRD
ncbi:MAG: hypothetical protein LBV69_03805, partial [Bacteroidales bacterium]|nr:hypothetical protein [Bacteroidales bacterium]